MLEQARLISQGRSIYKGMEGYPYAFSNYPPLVQALAALLIPLLGVTYAAGRIWNVLALFGLAALIYHVVRRQGGGAPGRCRGRPVLRRLALHLSLGAALPCGPAGAGLCGPGRGGGGRGGQDRAAGLGARAWRPSSSWRRSTPSTATWPRRRRPLPTCGCSGAAMPCACWPPRCCWAAGSFSPSTGPPPAPFALPSSPPTSTPSA